MAGRNTMGGRGMKARGMRAVSIWLNPDEMAAVQAAAEASGRKVAGYTKWAVVLAARADQAAGGRPGGPPRPTGKSPGGKKRASTGNPE